MNFLNRLCGGSEQVVNSLCGGSGTEAGGGGGNEAGGGGGAITGSGGGDGDGAIGAGAGSRRGFDFDGFLFLLFTIGIDTKPIPSGLLLFFVVRLTVITILILFLIYF